MAATRLLLVDDEDNLRSMLEAALRHSGFEVHPVANGRDAIDAASQLDPDLIVLDVGLPGRDGFDVIDELRRDRARSTPLIVYTARDLQADDRAALTLGLTRWLTKAKTTEEDLVSSVRELLNGLLPP